MQEQIAENLQFQNQNQSIMFQKYFEKYDTCLPYTRQNFMSEKDSMKQFIVKKNILKLASEKATSKFVEVYTKSIEDILNEIQNEFVFIGQLLTDFPYVDDKTYQAFDTIKEESLSIHNMLFIIAIKQVIRENEKEENKNIDYQECKRMIQAAKRQHKASSQNQLEENLKKKYQQQKKRKYLFQKSNNKEKLNQTKKTISKIEDLLNILKQYIKSKELYVQVAFDIPFLQLSKEILVTMDSTRIDIFNSLEIQNKKDLVIQIFKREDQSYVILENNKKLKDIVQKFPRFKGKIKKIFIVTFQNQSYKFSQNTSLQIIKDKLGSKDKTYGFWDENHRQIEDKYLNSNLQMFEFDQNIKLVFNDKLINNFKLPSSVCFRQLVRFVNLQNILPNQSSQEGQQIDDLFSDFSIRMIETNKAIIITDDQNLSINHFSGGGRIRKLYLSYKIYIKIDLLSNGKEGQIDLISFGDVKIKQLKNILMQKIGLNVQKQQWFFEEEQLKDEETLFKRLDNIYQNKLIIEVKQIKNLQYYGFLKIKEQISSNLFFDYSIEDDEKFVKSLQMSSFPDDQYQFAFRTACLRIIFASMKKHCSISSAINHIKEMINYIKLQNQHKNDLKDKLWLSFVKKDISRFNEGYILHYLLLYSSGNLRVAIMNAYKNQSPIFYRTFNSNNQSVSYHNEHFWLSSKSLVIASIQIGEKPENHIKGKSNALNMIFQTKFQDASLRNYYCSKSISIAYNIYRNDDLPVNIIDISSGSCSQQQKIEICNACNIIIVHYVQAQRKAVKKWCQDVCPRKICILLERDNDSVIDSKNLLNIEQQNNQKNRMRKHYTLPKLTNENRQHYANKLSLFINQINLLIQSQFSTSLNNLSNNNSNNLWLFSQFLQSNDLQKINATKTFKSIERNFQSIVNLSILMKQPELITPFQLQTMVISQDCKQILKFIKSKDNSQNYFSMLRYYIRSLREQRIKQFYNVEKLLKFCQNKQITESMTQQNRSKLKNEIIEKINNLISIPAKRKNQQFEKILVDLKIALNKQVMSNQILNYARQQIKKLNTIFITVIKQRQFSIQNLWRGLSILFNPNITVPNSIAKYKDQAQHLFNQTFKEGSYFEIINGDTMEVSINLMKTLQHGFLNEKKVIVVGVLGPQSSGKSTLLNYLFGCDFACSDGRCTSGVYGTYYQISGGIHRYSGVLILDTEGLFSTYQRKRPNMSNYDNKLVLFLIKICDIVIINTRGDIDGKSEQIVEVSFDSQLMKNNGGIYPHVFTVINQNGINLNMCSQQQNEVRKFIQKIIKVRKEMAKFISLNQTQSLPLAFNVNDKKQNSIVLQRIQKKIAIPTEDFYKKTKQLSLKILKSFKQRNPRILVDVLNKINAIWYSIITNSTYTRFKSKFIKQESFVLDKYTGNYMKTYLDIINEWIESIPQDIKQIQNFKLQREKNFKIILKNAQKQYQKEKVEKEKNPELKLIASTFCSTVKYNMELKMNSFRLNLEQRRKELQLKEFKDRGLYQITNRARQLKRNFKGRQVCQKKIQTAFNEVWQSYLNKIKENNTKEKISLRTFEEVQKFYQQYLNEQNIKITLNYKYKEMMLTQQLTLQIYSQSLLLDMKKHLINFHSYFTEIKEQPLIITSQNVNNSIKGQYLRMWQFFKFEQYNCTFYLSRMSLDNIWKKPNFKQSIANSLRTYNFNYVNYFSNYIIQLHKCLKHFSVQIKSQSIYKVQNQILYSFISKLENKMNNQSKNIYKMNVSKYNFNYQVKKQSRVGIFLGFFKVPTIKKFKQFKREYQSQNQCLKNSEYQLLNNPQFADRIKKLAQAKQSKTQFDYIKTLIQTTLNVYIQKYYEDLCFQYKQVKQRQALALGNIFLKIGILLQDDNKNIINYSNLNFKSVPFQISYKQHDQYEIKGYKLVGNRNSFSSVAAMHQQINKYSHLINSREIISNITEKPFDQQSLLIAEFPIQKYSLSNSFKNKCQNNHQIINIFSSYLNHDISTIAQKIKSPIFKQTIQNYINKFAFAIPIFDQIDKNVRLNGKIEDYFMIIQEKVNSQITKFNDDLKQISHCLFQDFKVKIYNYSACLLSKKLSILNLNQAKKAQQLMKQQRANQSEKFNKIIEGNQSILSAHLFIEYYQKHMRQYVRQIKYKYINKNIDCFLQKNKREKFLYQISSQLINNQQASQAYQYLTNPRGYLIKQYNELIQKELQQKNEQIKSLCPISQIRQFFQFFNHQKTKIVDKYGDQSAAKSQAHILFTYDSGKQDQNVLLAKLFLAILRKNPSQIDEDYNQNQFKVQKNVRFTADYTFSSHINTNFILRNDLKEIDLSISNYYDFLNEASKNLQLLMNKIKIHFQLTPGQRQNYQQRIKLKFCDYQCPFCKAYCEVDLRHHSNQRHKCFIGHQFRAIQNVTINLNHKGVTKKFGSLYRCQQIQCDQMISFDGTVKSWREFIQTNNSWDFQADSVFQNNYLLFDKLWRLAGKQICKQKQLQTQSSFQFITCQDFKMKKEKIKSTTNHYIFLLDSSGFTFNRTEWKNQLEQIKNFLSNLQNRTLTKISIIVWNYGYKIYYRHAKIQQIDISILKNSRNSSFFNSSSSFKGVIEIIKQCDNKENIIFVYTLNGDIKFPKQQIQQLKQLRLKVIQNQLSFNSMAININSNKLEFITIIDFFIYAFSLFWDKKIQKNVFQLIVKELNSQIAKCTDVKDIQNKINQFNKRNEMISSIIY